jgi:kynurenine formamidase
MIFHLDTKHFIDTYQGIDISIPLSNNDENPRAWYVDLPVFEPVRANGFIGSIKEGGAVNFRNIFFNPHGHGTHTECLGHITEEIHSINQNLKSYFFKAKLITIETEEIKGDFILKASSFEKALGNQAVEAVVIRTTPNGKEKKHKNYSASNPPYIEEKTIELFNKLGIKHLLIDLPSVDREEDGGKLAFHHAFWQVPENPQFDKTITEFIFVANEIKDGTYILNLQTAPFENDATPSRPVLFEIKTN